MAERSLSIRVSLKDYEKVQQGLQAIGAEGQRALVRIEKNAQSATKELDRTTRSTGILGREIRSLAAQAAAALGAREVIRMSDSYTLLTGKLKLVTGSTQELAMVQKELFRQSQESRASLDATATLYSRLAQSAEQLGLSQQQMMQLTDTTTKALRVSGATSQEAAAGVIQLSQALSAGKLQGDEFRSVLENMPRVARALEQALGVTRGELRQMANDGELTSQQVAQALLSQSQTIRGEFEQLPMTVGESFTQLGNSLTRLFGDSGPVQAAMQGVAQGISGISRLIDELNEKLNHSQMTSLDVIRADRDATKMNLEIARRHGHDEIAKDAEARLAKLDALVAINERAGTDYGVNFGPDPQPRRSGVTGSGGSSGGSKTAKENYKEYLQSLEEENRLIRMNARDRAIAERILRAENAARKDGKKLTDEQRRAIEEQAAAIYDYTEQQQRLADRQKEMWKPVEHAFERIQDSLADLIVSGDFSARSLIAIFKRAAAEIAAAMIIRPAIGNMFGGLIPGVSGSVTGGAGSGSFGSISGLSSLGSGLMNGFGTPVINPGIAFDIGSAFGLSADTVGMLHQGLANFTPLAGLASFGGGMAANLLGLSGKYSGITGTVGGLAGTFFGGPIGGAVGSFLGSALGGVFGGGKPHPGGSYGGSIDAMGNVVVDPTQTHAKHMDPAGMMQEAQALAAYLQTLGQLGAKFRPVVFGGIDDPATSRFSIRGERNFEFKPGDATSMAEAMRQMSIYLMETSGVVDNQLLDALKNVNTAGKDAAAVLSSVANQLGYIKGLQEFSDALARDPSTTNLSPEEQRKLAEQCFFETTRSGTAGLDQIQSAALAYLQSSQAYAGKASGVYAGDLSGVQAELTRLAANPPRFASGGDFAPGTFIVHPGETVMTSKTPGKVLNAQETRQMLSGEAQTARLMSDLKQLFGLMLAQQNRTNSMLERAVAG